MADRYNDHIRSAQEALTAARQLIQREISTYPTPVAGCDVQFNHLLADRQKILAALNSLAETVFVPTPRSPSPKAGVESR